MTERSSDVSPGDELGAGTEMETEFLIECVRRVEILSALDSAPAGASDLVEALDVSRSTIHRATNVLTDEGLVRKTNGRYELTGYGEVVAEKTTTYRNHLQAASTLEPFLNTSEADNIPVEHFADAKVTRPEPRQPHRSIHRITTLIERSTELRMFSSVLSPIYVDVAHREMVDGMEIQVVFDEELLDIILTEYEAEAREALETGRFDVHLCDEVPFELFLFDDRIGMAAHDDSGIARVFVECDVPAAIEWASDLYDRILGDAQPVLDDGP
ncbi:helix-turn-helix domain-containing protein [Halovivax sp.]|uniref:helix-turn-helix transcriptional regulator n=1 Tax=Halovivax sp. TaxID=1935978 RepID=UPI0025C55525|nr:helix-turn-helix domain-containing protein [Halovivax sp.]